MKTIFLLACLVVVACGRAGAINTPTIAPSPVPIPSVDPKPEPKSKCLIMAVWGAPWCHFCHDYLPKVQDRFDKLDGKTRDAIDFRVYVPTGSSSSSVPDDRTTIAYAKSLGLTAVPYNDPKWKVFRYAFGSGLAIPAGALFSADGTTVLKRYPNLVQDYQDMVYQASKECSK